MIDTVINLLFRCSHRRLTRPLAALTKPGEPHTQTYVVCLDCGKHFAYDAKQMRLGKAIEKPTARGSGKASEPSRMKFLAAAAPFAILAGAFMSGKKRRTGPEPEKFTR